MLEPQQHLGGGALDLPDFNDDTDFFDDEVIAKPKPPWWRRPRNIAIMSGVLVILIAAGVVARVLATRPPTITYTTAQVSQGNLAVTVSATGSIQSGTYNVNFSGSGKITEIDVSVGQQVKAGQLLAKLDPTSLQDALNQAQAQVNSAQTSLDNAYTSQSNTDAQAQDSINAAYTNQQTALAKCNVPSPPVNCAQTANDAYASAVAQANAQEASAANQVSSAQSQLNSAKLSLTTAQDNLANATLTAPHAGIVASVNGQVGGTPGSSSSSSGSSGSGGTFIQILDLSSLQVSAAVNETDIAKIAPGQVVTFTVSAYSTQRFHGTIASVSPAGTSSSGVVTYPVTINVDTSNLGTAKLLPLMTANVTITTAQRAGVLLMPASAVTFARTALGSGLVARTDVLSAFQQASQMLASTQSADANAQQDNLTASYVLERSNNKWVIKPVVLGLTNGTNYVVMAGLSDGETVVTGQQGGTTTTTGGTTTPRTGGGGFGGGVRWRRVRWRRTRWWRRSRWRGLDPARRFALASLAPAHLSTSGSASEERIPLDHQEYHPPYEAARADVASAGNGFHADGARPGASSAPASSASLRERSRDSREVAETPVISVRTLTKTYLAGANSVRALRGVTLDIHRGEFVAVMGPSGSGKSTFMNLLGCLDRPTSGQYLLMGTAVSSMTPDRLADVRNRRIGFVFQGFNLLPRASALANVALPMVYEGLPKEMRERRARRALQLVGLSNRVDHHPAQLSGGQQQRVAIARALVNGPWLLLADEPTGNLDSRTSVEIMALLQILNERGLTVVLVTHEADIASYATRQIGFRDGRVVRDEAVAAPRLARDEWAKVAHGGPQQGEVRIREEQS